MREADELTTFVCLNVMKIWEPKPPGTLWATPGLLRDCFTFTLVNELNTFLKNSS